MLLPKSKITAASDISTTALVEPVDTYTKAQKHAGIIIIGAGMAGSRFAIELARAQQQSRQVKYERPGSDDLSVDLSDELKTSALPLPITLISKEPQVGYNRIMLSPVLAGDTAFEDTYLYDADDYEQLGITVLSGVSVDSIDTDQQYVELPMDSAYLIPKW